MNIPVALAADMQLINDVLEGSSADVGHNLGRLIEEAALAVPSYLGLSVLVTHGGDAPVEITTLPEGGRKPIATSLRFRVSADPASSSEGPAVIELVMYAAQPGGLVDLAADLTWLTGRPLDQFRLDENLIGPQEGTGTSLASWSTVNQARGVLMNGGLTIEESNAELDARASSAGTSRHLAAVGILAGLPPLHPPPSY